jgi:uncharacterized SAM-binding protein YcdF (DUF218 family)
MLAGIGFLYITVTVTPLVNWWAGVLAGPWRDPKGETLIVLGGSLLSNGMIGESSYWRSVYASLAYQSDGFHRVIVSGGTEENPAFPVSVAMKNFMVCQGVPANVITAETESKTTRENALDVARLLAGDRSLKVLLTSDYHMFRAWRVFTKAGMNVAPRPFPDARKRGNYWQGRWPVFIELCLETVKIVYYYVRGWM